MQISANEIMKAMEDLEEINNFSVELPIPKRQGPKSYQIPFPYEHLPIFLKNLGELISPTTLSPDEFITTSLLTAMSSVVGTRAHIQLGQRIFYPTVWVMLIAPSSDFFKSTALWEGRKFIHNIDKEYQLIFKEEFKQYESDLEEYNCSQNKSSIEKPIEPIRKEIDFSDDETLESFYYTLFNNPQGGLITHGELGVWLENFNKYNKGGGEKKRWLTIFDNKPVKYKRKMNNTLLDIEKPFVSLCGGITSNTFTCIFRDPE